MTKRKLWERWSALMYDGKSVSSANERRERRAFYRDLDKYYKVRMHEESTGEKPND